MIQYLDLKSINLKYKNELQKSLDDILNSGWFILGDSLEIFERDYSKFSSTKYTAGVANGLDALIISLKALGIKEGDEVIVPSNTYIASWLAVSYLNAIPVPVEPIWETCNINPDLIPQAITSKTKAIMPVNLYGQAAQLNSIMKIAEKYGLYVIEDNAQAQGAMCAGITTGSYGHINATSFYPGKNLGALGDAGAITTDNETLINKVRMIRNYGSEKKYYNQVKGMNSRLDELQAAFLNIKLNYLIEENKERVRLAENYSQNLDNVGDIVLPVNAKDCTSVYHIYQIRTSQRDKLQKHLSEAKIGTMIHYPIPPHLQLAYSELGFQKGDFPIAESIAQTTLSIPLFPGMNDVNQFKVIETIKSFYNG